MAKALALILFFTIFGATAAPNIGIIKFLYASDANFQNKPKAETALEPGAIAKITQFNQNVLDVIQVQLVKFPLQLQQKLAESNTFASYNAESTVEEWKLSDSSIISTLENKVVEVGVDDSSSLKTSESPGALIVIKPHYILMGWIYSITSDITKNLIEGTDKKSILYNLDIKVKYKIINQDNKAVISEFQARGHGGYATILPASTTVNNYNSNVAVNNAISSLLTSIKHGLQIKESQGLLK